MECKLLELDAVELKFMAAATETDGPAKFAGYGAVFGNMDRGGDIIMPGAFAKSLRNKSRGPVKMYFNHDRKMPIGKYTRLEEDEKGLYVEGELTPGHSLARDVEAAMRHGTLDGLSIGYAIPPGGAKMDGTARRLVQLELAEVSVVSEPMNDKARVGAVKSDIASLTTISDVEDYLRDAGGFSKSAAMTLISRFKAILRDADGERNTDGTKAASIADLVKFVESLRTQS